MPSPQELLDAAESVRNMLVARATSNGPGPEAEYQKFRRVLVGSPSIKSKLPRCVRTCRTLAEFWGFIKPMFAHFDERRAYLRDEFDPLISMLEAEAVSPPDNLAPEMRPKPKAESTTSRRYYKQRRAGPDGELPRIPLDETKRLVAVLYGRFASEDWFQEVFGYDCVDEGDVPGIAGGDIDGFIFLKTWLHGAWPIPDAIESGDEAVLFTLIEFLHDNVSKPLEGFHHTYSGCGWHYKTFDQAAGKRRWRTEVNEILQHYGEGFELNWAAEVPAGTDDERVVQRMNAAVRKYRRGRSTWKERQEAVRELADVLEFLRKDAKLHLPKKDEADLFNIANNFSIRHNNDLQKSEYDRPVWLSWIFYVYLATIHLLLRLRQPERG
jgi:hypothetical protein